jgi:L-amino acid N-acyltransferase YncA
MIIRKADIEDLKFVLEIYNEAVLNTVATFDTEPRTMEQQKTWFEHHGDRHPLLVAEDDGEVVGWASLSAWSDRRAYDDTVEISLYVRAENRGRGVGKALMQAVVEAGKAAGLHSIIARIAGGNEASIRLHRSAGFQDIGVMREVGWKFGRRINVHLMQLIYREQEDSKGAMVT